jgi:outer membrane protein OmpA-like peptidoglycan-associated protein
MTRPGFALVLALSALPACSSGKASTSAPATAAGGGFATNRSRYVHTKITDKAIEIDEKIQFELGMANILPASDELLKEVADDLQEHPEIAELAIEGHASSDGSPEQNKTLSQQRADAVRKWLIDHGVDGARLVARGYGSERPIAPNDTEDNREKNRRVEFNIAKKNQRGL